MKKKLIIAIWIITISQISFAQRVDTGYDSYTNTWEPGRSGYFGQNNIPDNNIISGWQMKNTHVSTALKLFFLDSLYGWACHSSIPRGIVKTTDGGETWESIAITTDIIQLRSIYFIDRNTGWTMGSRVYRTTDGGSNWTNIPSLGLGGFSLYSVNFLNHDTGFIGGQLNFNKAMFAKTTNGGETWDSVFVSTYPNSNIRSQFWFDSETGWLGGGNCLLKTIDGGNTFLDYTQYLPFASNGSHGIGDIKFVNEFTGWIGGSNVDQKNIHKTTDGGFTWVFQDNPVAPYFFMQINAISFLNENTGWGAALVGMIIKTTNGGSNWFVDLSYQTEFWSMSYINNNRLWCGADWGQAWYLDYDKMVGISAGHEIILHEFKLHQNYPNPFNPVTVISYQLPVVSDVKIIVYDIQGREIDILINKRQNTGRYEILWNAENFSSGVYYYVLAIDDEIMATKKMVLLR